MWMPSSGLARAGHTHPVTAGMGVAEARRAPYTETGGA